MSKRKKQQPTLIKGTYHLSMAGFEADETRSLILRRRLQILVHSCIYYKLDESLISDSTWTQWAEELYDLQKQYPQIAERVDYHQYFKNFDPSTGYDLPFDNPEILRKAEQLLKYHKSKGGKKDECNIRIDLPGVRPENTNKISFKFHKGKLVIG